MCTDADGNIWETPNLLASIAAFQVVVRFANTQLRPIVSSGASSITVPYRATEPSEFIYLRWSFCVNAQVKIDLARNLMVWRPNLDEEAVMRVVNEEHVRF